MPKLKRAAFQEQSSRAEQFCGITFQFSKVQAILHLAARRQLFIRQTHIDHLIDTPANHKRAATSRDGPLETLPTLLLK